jgi:hypothetical protein
MARSVRIPWLIDLKRVDDKIELRALSADQGLDRRFEARGPLINRMLINRVNGALRFDGKPLPAVAPRNDADRANSQQALRKRLDGGPHWDRETVAALVGAVRGKSAAGTIGPAAQQAVGRLFDPAYVGDAESFAAARDLDDAVRTRNPLRWIMLHLTGRLRRSRRLLSDRVKGDLAGVHGSGIAVHNMVRGFEMMRELWSAPGPRPSADAAVTRCLFAPATVLRQATARASTTAGEVRPGTLVLYQLGAMRERTPDAETVFMAGTWAECPAMNFVPGLLRAVWQGAVAAEQAEQRS